MGELVASGSKITWVVLMKAGGHFAGAVFRGSVFGDHSHVLGLLCVPGKCDVEVCNLCAYI